ncbi:hypothetical protein CJ481_21585 [Bacillus subtilis]|nr:hypothetical protein CJ481_21585 [Bacillus subtilis]
MSLRFLLSNHFWDIPQGENAPAKKPDTAARHTPKSISYTQNTKETESKITEADSGSHCRISAKQYPLLNLFKHKGRKKFRGRHAPLNFSHTYVRLS